MTTLERTRKPVVMMTRSWCGETSPPDFGAASLDGSPGVALWTPLAPVPTPTAIVVTRARMKMTGRRTTWTRRDMPLIGLGTAGVGGTAALPHVGVVLCPGTGHPCPWPPEHPPQSPEHAAVRRTVTRADGLPIECSPLVRDPCLRVVHVAERSRFSLTMLRSLLRLFVWYLLLCMTAVALSPAFSPALGFVV